MRYIVHALVLMPRAFGWGITKIRVYAIHEFSSEPQSSSSSYKAIAMELIIILGLAGIFLTCYTCYLAVLRLYLSPVASFPGPRLAALTFWYEFYYDVIKGGKYTWKIAEWHKQYGPIIRINPFEIHINDPDFYDEIYVNASKRKTEIWSWTVSLPCLTHRCHLLRCCAGTNVWNS